MGGTLVLTGNNTYTGGTVVYGGILEIDGSVGNVHVLSGSVLGGNGTIGGNLHLDSGGGLLFSPVDTLTVNGGSVTFDGFSIQNLAGLDAATPVGIYTVLDGSATFDFANVLNLGSQNAFDLGGGKSAWFQEGSLQVVVIPEPSIVALLGLSLLSLLAGRRRRVVAGSSLAAK